VKRKPWTVSKVIESALFVAVAIGVVYVLGWVLVW
jgi:hypothetical protein